MDRCDGRTFGRRGWGRATTHRTEDPRSGRLGTIPKRDTVGKRVVHEEDPPPVSHPLRNPEKGSLPGFSGRVSVEVGVGETWGPCLGSPDVSSNRVVAGAARAKLTPAALHSWAPGARARRPPPLWADPTGATAGPNRAPSYPGRSPLISTGGPDGAPGPSETAGGAKVGSRAGRTWTCHRGARVLTTLRCRGRSGREEEGRSHWFHQQRATTDGAKGEIFRPACVGTVLHRTPPPFPNTHLGPDNHPRPHTGR